MPDHAQILRIVVASPGDVYAEREIVSTVAEELNKSLIADQGMRFEVVRWETDANPGFHPNGPQGLIDPILRIEDCDLLIGIFWKRFGTPTKGDASGTAHEFRLAYESWKKNGRPQVMVYFKQKAYAPRSKEETDQWGKVLEFRKAFPKDGLWWPYQGAADFERQLRTHLMKFVREKNSFPTNRNIASATQVPAVLQSSSRISYRQACYFQVQSKIISEVARTFVGINPVRKALDDFAKNNQRGYFILRAGPGQGKTAVCCSLVISEGYVHHFISRTGGRDDPRLILRSLIAQLVPLAEVDQPLPESIPELTKLYEELLYLAAERRSRVVVVIDGLDELPVACDEGLPYLVEGDNLPQGVFFLLTSRPGDRLDRLQERQYGIPTQTHELGPLSLSEMRQFLNSRNPGLSSPEVERIAEISQGNPLYLRAVLDQLEMNPGYDLQALPHNIESFFSNATGSLAVGNSVLHDVLGVFCAVRTPLSLADLAGIVGTSHRETYDLGIRPIRRFLLEIDRRYTFYHAKFHEFVSATLIYEDELRKSHRKIADWLQRPENASNEMRWASLAHHLFESDCHEALLAAIDEKFLATKVKLFGYGVLEDVELLTRCLLEREDPALVSRSVSIVEGLRAFETNIILDAARAIRLYRAGPAAFRTRFISPPVSTISGVDVFVGVLPKIDVAADFFEIVPSRNRLAVAIGDAPSVGIKSAFVARFIGNLFRSLVADPSTVNLGEVLSRINTNIATSDYFERISMQCIDVDPRGGIVHLANAGHPYPVFYAAARGKCDILTLRGNLLHDTTVTLPSQQSFEQYALEVRPGDVLVLLTDGLTEGHLLQGRPFGYCFTKIIEASAKESARMIGQRILDAWKAHQREEDTADDVSVIVVKIKAAIGDVPK